MEYMDSTPTSAQSRKRVAPEEDLPNEKPLNLRATQFTMPTPPTTDGSSNASPACSNDVAPRGPSPAPSTSTLSSVDLTGSSTIDGTTAAASSTQPARKRRKLTPSEKVAQQLEKDAKARGKAAQKLEKEQAKEIKDEEKRQAAETREAKKREKELEEKRKQNEKLKKERSQMRLGAFFDRSATTVKPSTAGGLPENRLMARRKSLSLEPFDAVADQIKKAKSPVKCSPGPQPAEKEATPVPVPSTKPVASEYRKFFLPFELPSHSTINPVYSLSDTDDLAYLQGIFDAELKTNCTAYDEHDALGLSKPTTTIQDSQIFATDASGIQGIPRGVGLPFPKLWEIAAREQGSSKRPIDLTHDVTRLDSSEALKPVTYRYLYFKEDVRPPYFGTYTKNQSPRTSKKVRRNPFTRALPDTDYDYESEAEWNEEVDEGEGKGEDCSENGDGEGEGKCKNSLEDGEEDNDADSQDEADDIDAFLDDEHDLKQARKVMVSDLQPVSTGLCWEDQQGELIVASVEATGDESAQLECPMRGMRLGFLLPGFVGNTIDPFSTAYWEEDTAQPPISAWDTMRAASRAPLQERSNANGTPPERNLLGAAKGEKGPIMKRGPKPQPKTLSKEDLEEFKEAVVGSPLGKVDLCKGLKTRFPNMTNDTIKDTLGSLFAQMGKTKTEKKWVFVGTL